MPSIEEYLVEEFDEVVISIHTNQYLITDARIPDNVTGITLWYQPVTTPNPGIAGFNELKGALWGFHRVYWVQDNDHRMFQEMVENKGITRT